jgi:fibronectin type 3 domain-containing protein
VVEKKKELQIDFALSKPQPTPTLHGTQYTQHVLYKQLNRRLVKKWIFNIVFFAISIAGVNGQEEPSKIVVTVRPTPNSVMLRWAPNTPVAWKYLNQYGYRIDRYTVMRDSTPVANVEKRILTPMPLKPLELSKWEKMVDTSDNAAIVAQAIYGQSFEVTSGDQTGLARLSNMSKDLESRFSFALFASTQSIKVAEAAGLFFNDVTANPHEYYLYRILSLVPDSIEHIDSAFVYTGIPDYEPLPKPVMFSVEFNDRYAIIKWNKTNYEEIFNNYIIERSDDNGKTYRQINAAPYVSISNEINNSSHFYMKTDSVPISDKRYYYRVKGITVFGEISNPSDTMSGYSVRALKDFPGITASEINYLGQVQLKWSYPSENIDDITGFKVVRSNRATSGFDEVSPGILSSATFEFIDTKPLNTNYYKIQAIGKNKNVSESFPYLVQLEDSIPPAAPLGLTCTVDSLGKVTLKWDKNTEPDLKGYLVFRANYLTDEFAQITTNTHTTNLFFDTVTLQTLSRNVYYKIKAIDNHFNQSAFSKILAVTRPDIIPPQPPVISYYKVKNNKVFLKWNKSVSADVQHYFIYRRYEGETSWLLLSQFTEPDTVTSFTDNVTGKEGIVEYVMIAVDSSRLESQPTKPLKLRVTANTDKNPVKQFYAKTRTNPNFIDLTWNYAYDQVVFYQIYKSEMDKPVSMYRSVKGAEQSFSDSQVKPGRQYKYMIKAVFADGTESPLSKPLEVTF